MEQLSELAEELKGEAAPVEALRRWLRSNVEFVATKKGMATALALAAGPPSELTAFSFERLTKAIHMLLQRAVAAGEVRAEASVVRMLDVLVDGLRVQSDTGKPPRRSPKA